jgi:broad specificity phosphatase PhoE
MTNDGYLRLLLIRHGETADNAAGQFIGTRNDKLTPRGIEQARRLARVLENLPITALYSSPLVRATTTAAHISENLDIPVFVDSRLAEQNFCGWEGSPFSYEPKTIDDTGGRSWTSLSMQASPPGGEPLTQVQDRVLEVTSEIEQTFDTGVIILVTHVGPIKALLCAAMGAPLEVAERLFLNTGTISVIDWKPLPLVRKINAAAHFDWIY